MSAFLCSAHHISCVVNSMNTFREIGMSGGETFRILADANAKSVDYRYREDGNAEAVDAYRYDPMARVSPVATIKAIHCLRYQSCEIDNYEETEAAKLLDRLEAHAIRSLPGYEAAPWGIEEAPHSGAFSLFDLAKR